MTPIERFIIGLRYINIACEEMGMLHPKKIILNSRKDSYSFELNAEKILQIVKDPRITETKLLGVEISYD